MRGREQILADRRARAAAAWDVGQDSDAAVVLVAAGQPILRPGKADQIYPFIPHSEYFWLTDRSRPGSLLAFDPGQGWVDFVPPVSQAERVWEGGGQGEDTAGGSDVAGLERWLEERAGRPLARLGAPHPGLAEEAADARLSAELGEKLLHARRRKDELELERMRRAAAASARGFEVAREWLRAGVTERRVQIELEAAFLRAGADRPAYDTIVGSGPNSAVLHFAPGPRELGAGELVLIDAGAEVAGYAADVTRTYPVGGRFTGDQHALYQVVLAAEERAIERCRAGVEYRAIHEAAALDIARGLVDFGLLRGAPESLVERHAQALFFPHGIGHMVGLGVRDAGGYLSGRERRDDPTSRYLRVDLPLHPGYTVTIEPGVYFIPALLDDAENRERYRDAVDWQLAERLRGLGGIRIEDNVLVTDGEPEVLTAAIDKRL